MNNSTMTSESAWLIEADRAHVLHGFAPVDDTEPGMVLRSAHGGVHLVDVDGNDWLDGAGGQANMSLGYSRHDLADVAGSALRELAYSTHFYHRRGHVHAARLAERLAGITPAGVEHFFFTLGGSDAVETAIKFARFVNIVGGRPEKLHVIGRWHSYHGVSYGAASLTGDPAMWEYIGPRLPGFSHIGQPARDSVGAAAALEQEILRIGPENVAAFMAEPVSTPYGIVPPPEDYWPQIRDICDRYDVLLIADEVLTGFGRTGAMFALENWGVSPDILTMSKAITAGYFPLAAVGITARVRDALAVGSKNFVHGFTAGGHPAGCATALATLDIMEAEDVLGQCRAGGKYLLEQITALSSRHPVLSAESARGIGMMVAIDIHPEQSEPGFGTRLHREFFRQRVLVRRYRQDQTIGLLPALTTTTAETDEIIERMDNALTAVTH